MAVPLGLPPDMPVWLPRLLPWGLPLRPPYEQPQECPQGSKARRESDAVYALAEGVTSERYDGCGDEGNQTELGSAHTICQ